MTAYPHPGGIRCGSIQCAGCYRIDTEKVRVTVDQHGASRITVLVVSHEEWTGRAEHPIPWWVECSVEVPARLVAAHQAALDALVAAEQALEAAYDDARDRE